MNQKIYEEVKRQVIKEAAAMRKMNQIIPVTGERMDLPLEDRKVNIVLYRSGKKCAPLILGFHGGGFLFGGNAMNDAMWSAVRDRLDCHVASVEYRKSPDYQWREALADAFDAAVYLKNHAESFGADPERFSVMGCSAGAGLAASLCIYGKKTEKIQFLNQILMYPFLDLATDPDSKGRGSLEGEIMYVFNDLHRRPEEAELPEVSPVYADRRDLEGLPHAVFCMADYDNLKQEGYRYARMLKDAGVDVAAAGYPGMPHGFFESGFGEISEEEMFYMSDDMKVMIRNGAIAKASEEALEFVAENIVI